MLSNGVVYLKDSIPIVWNGLISVTESDSDSEAAAQYIDGRRVAATVSYNSPKGTIEAFTYPPELYDAVLRQNGSKPFGFSYKQKMGSTYLIHVLYNVKISRESFLYQQVDLEGFSFDYTTIPAPAPNGRRSAHLIIDSSIAAPGAVVSVETTLQSRLPPITEIYSIFENYAQLVVTDLGDGTFTVSGPDTAITMLDATTFQIDWPSAEYLDNDTYTIYTY